MTRAEGPSPTSIVFNIEITKNGQCVGTVGLALRRKISF
jgi:hypothetical protein